MTGASSGPPSDAPPPRSTAAGANGGRTRAFDTAKGLLLEGLLEGGKDRSKKGSLDAPIVELVGLINRHPDYVTTSSCSGRIALFEDVDGAICRKAGGAWLLSSHSPVVLPAVRDALHGCRALGQPGGSVTLKQEPLVLHVECRDLAAAEALLRVGVGSGFRESGISLGKKRVLCAIRTGANSLEAPVVLGGQQLLTEPGLEALVALANTKFELNVQRTKRLEETLQAAFAEQQGRDEEQEAAGPEGEAGPAGAAGMTARQAKRREKALARRREKDDAKRKARGERAAAAASRLEWRKLSAAGGQEARRLLQRWGHSLCRVDDDGGGLAAAPSQRPTSSFWVFGGYGYTGPGRPVGRLNSLLEVQVDASTGALAAVALVVAMDDIAALPEAREQHGAAVLRLNGRATLVVFGGRASPAKPFGDLWRFDRAGGWRPILDAGGRAPCPRWGHSMAAVDSQRLVVYGGRDAQGVFGGRVHVLAAAEEGAWAWSEVVVADVPPLFLHTASWLPGGEGDGGGGASGRLLLYGGMTDLSGRSIHAGGALVSLDGKDSSSSGVTPVAGAGRYAHAAAVVDGAVWITGGMTGPETSPAAGDDGSQPQPPQVLRVDGATGAVAVVEGVGLAPGLARPTLLHHAVASCARAGQPPLLVSMGGGVQTFAFSPVFDPPLGLGPPASTPQRQQQQLKQPQQPKQQKQAKKGKATDRPAAAPPAAAPRGPPCPCLLVAPADTKRVKTALERAGLFDKQRRITPSATREGLMAIPLALPDAKKPDLAKELRAALLEGAAPASRPVALVVEALTTPKQQQQQPQPTLAATVQGWAADTEAPPFSAAALQGQALRLKTALEQVLVAHAGLDPAAAAAALPPAFLARLHVERLGGDVLLLEDDSPLLLPAGPWASLPADRLWPALLGVFPGATRVARMARIQEGPKRRSQVRLLYPPPPPPSSASATRAQEEEGPGSPGWVTVRENGLTYSFDFTKVMFSSGNVSEKERIARLDCRGETVVDLYAGIGYYTLPLAVHGRAARVVACEWNPDACLALRHNVAANGVAGRVEVLFGDNRETTRALPDGIAHRVHLGLLPSSEEGWPVAARLLRPEGGWLHVHANVLESAAAAWAARVEREITALGRELGRPWAEAGVRSRLVRVKSFAPRIWHLVLDVQCGAGAGAGV